MPCSQYMIRIIPKEMTQYYRFTISTKATRNLNILGMCNVFRLCQPNPPIFDTTLNTRLATKQERTTCIFFNSSFNNINFVGFYKTINNTFILKIRTKGSLVIQSFTSAKRSLDHITRWSNTAKKLIINNKIIFKVATNIILRLGKIYELLLST